MRVVLLTSDKLRHKYIAASLAKATDLSLVITEQKSSEITDTSQLSKNDAEFMDHHFAQRTASEADFFGSYSLFPQQTSLLQLQHGQINTSEVLAEIQEVNPDLIVLFGTSIIKEPLLKEYHGRIINLHLGLSPYYRGSATNLYPYLFDEPECIGATVHLATNEVDQGGILFQLRPAIKKEDSLHDLGNRTIFEVGQILPEILKKFDSGEIKPVPQKCKGRLTRNRDITPYVLREIYKNFKDGMIGRYLKDKEKRDNKKPIVEQI